MLLQAPRDGATLALHTARENARYHGVSLTPEGRITGLDTSSLLINGGCYLFRADTLRAFSHKEPISLEREILLELIEQEQCFVTVL